MSTIQILPPELQNQIAAGEVVERPASIVKELVENSLDAGANLISVSLTQGGQSLIQVQDNGRGLHPEDIPLALTRHATSKLQTIDDLQQIQTFGFRGEALPSIASVSRLILSSIVPGAEHGTRVEVEFGKIRSQGPCPLREGTKVEVRDLFLNTPARLKFLKSPAWEGKKCQEALFKLALANLEAGFNLQVKDKNVLQFAPKQDLVQRLAQVWPRQITDLLLPLEIKEDTYRLTGVIGPPETAQGRAGRILFFVNKRPVQDRMLLAALRQGYKGKLLSKEYPQAVLFLELPPQDVDVNVHPAKAEVRFRAEHAVFSLIAHGISELIGSQYKGLDLEPQVSPITATSTENPKFKTFAAYLQEDGSEPDSPGDQGTPANTNTLHEPTPRGQFPSGPSKTQQTTIIDYSPPQPGPQRQTQTITIKGQSWTFLGQIHKTYLLFSTKNHDRLLILDQHAAHERILFAKLSSGALRGTSQLMAIPSNFQLNPGQTNQLTRLSPYLRSLGFTFTLEANQVWLEGQPSFLAPEKAKKIFLELVSEQIESIDHLLAHIACRQAIKAGAELSANESLILFKDWLDCPKREFCPHGRPTMLDLDPTTLEKLFKRKK